MVAGRSRCDRARDSPFCFLERVTPFIRYLRMPPRHPYFDCCECQAWGSMTAWRTFRRLPAYGPDTCVRLRDCQQMKYVFDVLNVLMIDAINWAVERKCKSYLNFFRNEQISDKSSAKSSNFLLSRSTFFIFFSLNCYFWVLSVLYFWDFSTV